MVQKEIETVAGKFDIELSKGCTHHNGRLTIFGLIEKLLRTIVADLEQVITQNLSGTIE